MEFDIKCLTPNSVIVELVQKEIKSETFPVFSFLDDKVIASRQQIPLCLTYCITIHKAGWVGFYAELHQFSVSEEYIKLVKSLFKLNKRTIGSAIMKYVLKYLII